MHLALLPNHPINLFKPVYQCRQQTLRAYCRNIYTVNSGSPLPPDQRSADPIVRQQQATSQQKPKRRRKQKPKAQNSQKRPNSRRKGQKKPKPNQRTQTAG